MKGIVLAGGAGTRLHPCTSAISKQLLPIYDKPMVFYPLSTLKKAGIHEIAIITTPRDNILFRTLLGDGRQYGLHLTYIEQPEPKGIAQAILLAKDFLGKEDFVLILGDNIFDSPELSRELSRIVFEGIRSNSAEIFLYKVKDPERYGVAVINEYGLITDLVEKPKSFISDYAVTGVYAYSNSAVTFAEGLKPSSRGELEITDLNNKFLLRGNLDYNILNGAWLDTGTFESLIDAANYVRVIQERRGENLGCL